jgi:hypothetical protein
MKKIIPLIFLIGCSQKEVPTKFEHDKVIVHDTLVASFSDEIKNIKSSIETKNISTKRSKDSLSKQIKKLHVKNKNLQYENDFYLDAIDGYSDVLMQNDSIK